MKMLPFLLIILFSSTIFAQYNKESKSDSKINWFGVWKEGLAEAKRTKKPILLIAAAPHCHNVSGLW